MHPTDGTISQEVFEPVQASGQAFPHTGRDYRANRGDTVRTIADGTVIHAGSGPVPDWLANRFQLFPGSSSGGNYVFIQHEGWVEYFGHLDTIDVGPGATVRRGQRIGGAGDSGAAQGVHLHYEVIEEPCPGIFPWGRYHPQLQIDHENRIAGELILTGTILEETVSEQIVKLDAQQADDIAIAAARYMMEMAHGNLLINAVQAESIVQATTGRTVEAVNATADGKEISRQQADDIAQAAANYGKQK